MRIIINADDFGADREGNKAICECFKKGLCTNTTLMVNKPFTDEAVALAKDNSFFDRVGLHINLTEGRPLTERIRCSEMFCDKEGNFNDIHHFRSKAILFLNKSDSDLLKEEIEAQIVKYLSYGLNLLHIDSHHHIHTSLPVFRVISSLAPVYGIKSVRLSRNMYDKMDALILIYKKYYNRKIRKMNFKTVNFFGSFYDFNAFNDKTKDSDILEIMVHPRFDKDGVLLDADTPMVLIEQSVLSQNTSISYRDL